MLIRKVSFDEIWKDLKVSVEKILQTRTITKAQTISNFSDIYSLCMTTTPEPLSIRLHNELEKCVAEHVKDTLEKLITSKGDILQNYCALWSSFHDSISILHNQFRFLNQQISSAQRTFEDNEDNRMFLWKDVARMREVGCMGFFLWKDRLVLEGFIDKLTQAWLSAIDGERKGHPTHKKGLLKKICFFFSNVENCGFEGIQCWKCISSPTFFETHLELPYLEQVREYTKERADRRVKELSVADYHNELIEIVTAEVTRFIYYMPYEPKKKITEVCKQSLVTDHCDFVFSGTTDFLEKDQIDILFKLFQISNTTPQFLTIMGEKLGEYLYKLLLEVSPREEADPQQKAFQFIQNIIKVHNKYNHLNEEYFGLKFTKVIEKTFGKFINSTNSEGVCVTGDMIALYTDVLLRKPIRPGHEARMQEQISKVLKIVKYLENKEEFETTYMDLMCRRLIEEASPSIISESFVVKGLKKLCSEFFFKKTDKILRDIRESTELEQGFLEITIKCLSPEEFKPLIVTRHLWPLPPYSDEDSRFHLGFKVPPYLRTKIDQFEHFYKYRHTEKKLQWLYNRSHGEIKTNHLPQSYSIQMNVMQIAVLLCFNEKDTATISEISTEIGFKCGCIALMESLRESHLLSCSDQTLSMDSMFSINWEYSNVRNKVKLPVLDIQMSRESGNRTENTLSEDQKHYVDLAIVRTMKREKLMSHGCLINEVKNKMNRRFKPTVALIKSRIESLIEKEYLERTNNKHEYKYVD